MNVYLPNLRLPSAYQEVEYIETTGTQYIDTGISAPNGFRAVFKMSAMASASESKTIVGAHNTSTPRGRNNINLFTIGNTRGLHMNDEMLNSLGSVVIGQIYEVDGSTILGASYLDVDGVRLTTGSNTSPMSSNNILIFTNQYEINAHSTFVSAKLYSCMLYNSSYELVRDFVPCYRKSDSVIGLYDLVNNQFYTNSGTGTFSKGNDVTMAELKNAYIGEVWTPGSNTIAYYPLTENANDESGNGNNGTVGGNVTFSSNGAYLEGTGNSSTNGRITLPFNLPQVGTISGWFKFNTAISGSEQFGIYVDWESSYRNLYMSFLAGGGLFYLGNGGTGQSEYTCSFSLGTSWNNFVISRNNQTITYYLNGTQVGNKTYSYNPTTSGGNTKYIGNPTPWTSPYVKSGYIKDYIAESTARTAEEITKYYNQTKSNYGL